MIGIGILWSIMGAVSACIVARSAPWAELDADDRTAYGLLLFALFVAGPIVPVAVMVQAVGESTPRMPQEAPGPSPHPDTRPERLDAGLSAVAAAYARFRGHVCEWCGDGTDLQVHHIIPRDVFTPLGLDELYDDPRNLVTLCQPCHLQIGHIGNWGRWNPGLADMLAAKKGAPRA